MRRKDRVRLFAFPGACEITANPDLAPRKQPRQRRSRQMRDDLLAASLRVFQAEGALRFTTQRVAEAAGVSVGSLYQYFPNKHALVHALHQQAMAAGWDEVNRLLNEGVPPRERLRRLARWFFRKESEEAALMGPLLKDAELFLGQGAHDAVLEAAVLKRLEAFIDAERGPAARAEAPFLSRLLATTIESVGKFIAGRGLSLADLDAWSEACADMLADYCGFD